MHLFKKCIYCGLNVQYINYRYFDVLRVLCRIVSNRDVPNPTSDRPISCARLSRVIGRDKAA